MLRKQPHNEKRERGSMLKKKKRELLAYVKRKKKSLINNKRSFFFSTDVFFPLPSVLRPFTLSPASYRIIDKLRVKNTQTKRK